MEIWTAATPNGWKVSIMIEELREAGVNLPDIEVRTINLMKGEQFSAEFTAHNPNQKIPVLIDGARSVIIARNRMSNARWGRVGIQDSNYRNAQFVGFLDGNGFLVGIDDHQQVGCAAHILDAAKRPVQLVALTRQPQRLLLGKARVLLLQLLFKLP